MIIIGVDPGTRLTGYGIIKVENGRNRVIKHGVITTSPKAMLTDRYLYIFTELQEIIDEYTPDVLAVETQFVHKNVPIAMKLGMVRGIAILAAKQKGLPIYEYSPKKAKKAVVGNGNASKPQVQQMVKMLLTLKELPPEDAADALALAICHAQSLQYQQLCGAEI